MSLRRKIILKDCTLLVGLFVLIAAALWGFYRQRQHVQASLNEYAALHHVELAEASLIAFQQAVHEGQMTQPKSLADLRAATTAMSQYKAVISQYDTILPPEITPDLQADVKDKTKTLVSGLVKLTMQLDPPASVRTAHAENATPPDAAVVSASLDQLSGDLASLLWMCNGFVHRTGMLADQDLHLAITIVACSAGAMLLIAIAGSLWQYQKVVVPLHDLRLWCRRTAGRDFSARYTPTNEREFVELAQDVNQMADELNAFYQKLEAMVSSKSRELVRSERLASVGYLAAGVAHEINSPLNIMSGYAELSLKRLKRTPETADAMIAEHLSIIRSEAFRCKEITHKLLSLAKGNGDAREVVSLYDATVDVAGLVRGLRSFRNKQLRMELDRCQPLYVKANLTELKQVLLNLIVNAIEAVSEQTGVVMVNAKRVFEWVELEVSDNGRGMTAETLERVFEPFFTNKRGAGEPGTGLGLSITHAIVAHHGGEIRAYSDGPNQGSRFVVRFPAGPDQAVSVPQGIDRRGGGGMSAHASGDSVRSMVSDLCPPRSASQRVLIVEDEKRLREMLHASITEMGLQPMTAGSGEAALKLVNQHFFALAVLDLNLPGMDGLELAERLHEIKPHIQVIILTGFGDLEAAQKAIRLEVVDFLTKPCGMDDLENALNRARLRWLDRWSGEAVNEVERPAYASPSSEVPRATAIDTDTPASMDDMERELILAALARHDGNRQAAATELGISVRKLYYRLQTYHRQGLIKSE